MKIKDIFKLIKKAYKADGCILITKSPYIAECTRFGECTNYDIVKYTKGFDNGNSRIRRRNKTIILVGKDKYDETVKTMNNYETVINKINNEQ